MYFHEIRIINISIKEKIQEENMNKMNAHPVNKIDMQSDGKPHN